MAIVLQKGEILYLQWYDAIAKKVKTKSTGMVVNDTNIKKAEAIAKRLQEELTSKRKKLRRLGIQKVTIKDAKEHFLRNNQNKHPKTIKDYERFFKKFTETFEEDFSSTSINKIKIEDWLIEIKSMDRSLNTIHSYGKQLNHFLNFLFEYHYTPWFKINKEVKTRPEVKEKIIFTDEAITAIFKNLKLKNSNFQTTVYILFYTGLRSSDILSINANNVDLKNKIIHYYSPKRKKFREVAFHKDLLASLKKRIKEVKVGRLLDYNNIENLGRAIKRYLAKDLKITEHYTARTFRKTFITLCRSRYNMDASVVRELVGHEQGNTTDKYYNQVSIDTMREELKKFVRPIFKKKKQQ
jgi:integrase